MTKIRWKNIFGVSYLVMVYLWNKNFPISVYNMFITNKYGSLNFWRKMNDDDYTINLSKKMSTYFKINVMELMTHCCNPKTPMLAWILFFLRCQLLVFR